MLKSIYLLFIYRVLLYQLYLIGLFNGYVRYLNNLYVKNWINWMIKIIVIYKKIRRLEIKCLWNKSIDINNHYP